MNRQSWVAMIEAQVASLPGSPHDAAEEQKERRETLREALREVDKYNPGQPRRTEPITAPRVQGARCANCGSSKVEIPRPVVAA